MASRAAAGIEREKGGVRSVRGGAPPTPLRGRRRGNGPVDRFKDLCIIAQPGSRLPEQALFAAIHIGDGLSIKSIRCNRLRHFKRLPGGRQALPGVPPGGTVLAADAPLCGGLFQGRNRRYAALLIPAARRVRQGAGLCGNPERSQKCGCGGMVDARVSNTLSARSVGSSPTTRTTGPLRFPGQNTPP